MAPAQEQVNEKQVREEIIKNRVARKLEEGKDTPHGRRHLIIDPEERSTSERSFQARMKGSIERSREINRASREFEIFLNMWVKDVAMLATKVAHRHEDPIYLATNPEQNLGLGYPWKFDKNDWNNDPGRKRSDWIKGVAQKASQQDPQLFMVRPEEVSL